MSDGPDVPDLSDQPLDWDPATRRFQPRAGSPGADERRITIPAPTDDAPATAPPRRAPVVVAPSPDDVAAGAATSARSAPADADTTRSGDSSTMPGTPVASGAARPAAGATGSESGSTTGTATSSSGDAAPGAVSVRIPAPEPAPTDDRSSPPPSPARPAEGTRPGSRWRPTRRTVVRVAAGTLVAIVVFAVVGLFWGWRQFSSIETVELDSVLAFENGTNYLIVGSDTRDGVDPNDPDAAVIIGDDTIGGPERSDTILILRVADGQASMLSVPRDLLVTIAETGERTRINAAFNGGPTRLIATLTAELGLPIHHYLEVDFVSFRDLVDALGGITIDFPHPAYDENSGLRVDQAGPVRLDGTQALAFVRSRFYVEVIDGREVPQGNGDLGRVVRQQQFLSAVVAEIGGVRNPFRLQSITAALVDGMRIDDRLSFFEAAGLLWRFRSLDPVPNSLPTRGLRTSGGAAVLELVQPGADEILAGFGSSGAR